MVTGKYDQAEALYRAVLETVGKDTDEGLIISFRLAQCLMLQGKREEAIPYAQRAVDGYRQILGTNDGRTTEAERLFEDLQRKK